MRDQENVDQENDEPNLQFTTPYYEYQNFITQLNQRYPVFLKENKAHVHEFFIEKQASKNTLLQKILLFRFINALRVKSGNVSIDSIRCKHLSLINDLSADTKFYQYKGSSISRLIKQQQEKQDQHFTVSIFLASVIHYLPLLQPNCRTSMIFDFITLLVTLIQLIQVPLILTFNVDNMILQYFIYFYLTFDSFRSVFTGIYVDGNLVMDRNQIFFRHLQQQLPLDIITIYQFWIFQDSYFLRLLFLLRFTQINEIINKLEIVVNISNQNLITLIKSIFLMIFSTHLMSCFQYMIQQSTHTEWQSIYPMQDSIISDYIQGLYWSVTTMVSVGYGDVRPINNIQKLYTSFIMFIGICLFSFVMNSIGNVINLMNENRKNHNKFKISYEMYYKSKPLSQDVYNKIRDYNEILYEFHESSNNYGQELLLFVSEELKLDYIEQVNGRIVKNNYFFNKFSQHLKQKIVDELHEQFYLPTDLVAQDTNELFVLSKGAVKLVQNTMIIEVYDQQNTNINIINFITQEKEVGSYICTSHTLIYKLRKLNLVNPLDYELFQQIKDDIVFNQNYKIVGLVIITYYQKSCSVCFSPLHLIKNCPEIHFSPNLQKILKQQKSVDQLRKLHIRSKHQKSRTFNQLNITQMSILLFIEDSLSNYQQNIVPSLSGSKLQTQQLDFPQYKSSVNTKNDTFAQLGGGGQNSSRMIYLNSECVNSTNSVFETNYDFNINFEHLYEFKHYFTSGNVSNIIKEVNKSIRKPRVKRLQTIIRTGVLKIIDPLQIDEMKQKIKRRKNRFEIDRNLISQLQLLGETSKQRSKSRTLYQYHNDEI